MSDASTVLVLVGVVAIVAIVAITAHHLSLDPYRDDESKLDDELEVARSLGYFWKAPANGADQPEEPVS